MPPRLSFILASLLIACTPARPGPHDQADEPEPARVEAEPNPVQQRDGPEYFFATVGQSGIEHCPDGGDSPTWLNVHDTLGWVPTSGATAALDALMDQPVLARGQSGPTPKREAPAVDPAPCPMMQMRSDWVSTPRSIQIQRNQQPKIEHFEVTSARRLDELTATREGDEVVVSFTNPLPFALADVQLELHYEGCYGKPGSTMRASEQVPLEPGGTLTKRFSLIAEQDHDGPRKGGPTAREHAAASLVLSLGEQADPEGNPVHADLDVSLSDLGVAFECP